MENAPEQTKTTKDGDRVAVLMCTYNGETYLQDQIDSFVAQDHPDWELWVSDDGSTDRTWEIVEANRSRMPRLTVVSGPRKGHARNFLELMRRDDIDAPYVAWSDQDDVWFPDKLSRAVAWLCAHDEVPAIYSSRTMLVDAECRDIGISPLFTRHASFRNALCQNIGGGNTMVFNRRARRLLAHGPIPEVFSHDWWAYMLVTGAGGVFGYDPKPTMFYRQHGRNIVGENKSIREKVKRLVRLFSGEYHEWNRQNIEALTTVKDLLTPDNEVAFQLFAEASRSRSGLARYSLLKRAGVYRQSYLHNVALIIAAYCRRYP